MEEYSAFIHQLRVDFFRFGLGINEFRLFPFNIHFFPLLISSIQPLLKLQPAILVSLSIQLSLSRFLFITSLERLFVSLQRGIERRKDLGFPSKERKPRNMHMLSLGLMRLKSRFIRRQLFSTPASNGGQRLAGKIALITGAASGIGRATAIEFTRNGAKVILADINCHLGQSTADELGHDATFVPCDVTQESDFSSAIDTAISIYGRLDILHNNAGIAGCLAPSITALDMSDFDRTMAVNVRSVVTGLKHAARVMIPQRAGCIICTASDTGIMGGIATHDYSISKAAVIGAMRSVAAELSKHGIRVNCISPHAIATPLGVNAMKKLAPDLEVETIVEKLNGSGELEGAICEAEDVARAAVYLASDEAKYVNGHNLVVDGGFTAFKMLKL